MSEAKTQIESIRKWVVEHKLRTVGNFLNLALHSFFLIDGLHAQALTLGALAGAALVEYYDRKTGAKAS
ncbi:hypothetical protein JHK85_058137 [Glycine max]|nr:hypothetical protein JHK85_058137 [Glycine max]